MRLPKRATWPFITVLISLATLFGLHSETLAQGAPQPSWSPPRADQRLSRIAFGSCLDQRYAQPIWRQVVEAKPDLFLMLGDNVYGDAAGSELKELKEAYAMQAANPELAAARERMPFLATWDDHDYGWNDAGAEFPHKVASRALFASFWSVPEALLPKDGIYRAHIVGPPGARVQVILLDLRTFRSAFLKRAAEERKTDGIPGPYKPDSDPAKTMLGPAQWAWLAEQLKVPAEIRIIASSTQLLAEAHGFERWGHLPAEKARLIELIKSSDARGVIVVSGDRHRAAIYKRTDGLNYPLYEVTSSALNRSRAGAELEDAGRLGPMLAEDNFGIIDIDWTARTVRLSLMPLSGRSEVRGELSFRELGVAHQTAN